ncbi:VIP peptides isoform X1 [Prionailurus iriomotensis]
MLAWNTSVNSYFIRGDTTSKSHRTNGATAGVKDAALGVLPGDPHPRQWLPLLPAIPAPQGMPRYADAIFTNSYRKVLGQLSARKLLQDIMSRQQGERNQEQGAKVRLGRQVDSVWAGQKQMALESILVALLQKHRNSQG